ncbi:MAG: hypothetical protein N3E37_05000, partial [Candidatus Micrarchaeota archaeon]|nr:hypothetical protein [Candidatus Micrarchaeota archaeon]
DYTEIEFSYKKDIVVNDKIEKSLKTKIAEEAYEKLQDVNDEYILASGCVSISTDEIEIEDGEIIIG